MIPDPIKFVFAKQQSAQRTGQLKKAFRLSDEKQSILFSRFDEDLLQSFISGTKERTVAIFADIFGFSKTISNFSAEQTKQYLDEYYSLMLPIIYSHGGEIEKLIGDGILAIFGPPFLDDYFTGLDQAWLAIQSMIKAGIEEQKELKIALRLGTGIFTYVGQAPFIEPTVVGPLLTEVFRLEEASKKNCLSVYSGTEEAELIQIAWDSLPISNTKTTGPPSGFNGSPEFVIRAPKALPVKLKGISHEEVLHYEFAFV